MWEWTGNAGAGSLGVGGVGGVGVDGLVTGASGNGGTTTGMAVGRAASQGYPGAQGLSAAAHHHAQCLCPCVKRAREGVGGVDGHGLVSTPVEVAARRP